MKNRILSAVFALLLLTLLLAGCNADATTNGTADPSTIIPPKTEQTGEVSAEYTKIAENQQYALHFNESTTHFSVVRKSDGKVYSSLPKEELTGSVGSKSLFELTYLSKTGTVSSLSSYEDSVKKGQFKTELIENGVKVTYTLGNVSEKLFCPTAFTVERFEEIVGKIESSFDKSKFKSMYYKVSADSIKDSSEKADLLSKYPPLKEKELYILKNDNLSLSVKRTLNGILVKTGYTDADYEKDMKDFAHIKETLYPVFNVSLYITLGKDGLQVKIPSKEIAEFYGGQLLSIDLLKYFAAPAPGTEGYFLLPDATGSRMNFFNGKHHKSMYSVSVYGNDKSIPYDEQIYHQDHAYLPIFVNVAKDGAVFNHITGGASIARVNALPGDEQTHASAYTSFQYRQISQTYLDSASKEQGDFFYVTQDKLFEGDLELTMTFFDGTHATLKDFADYYRTKLFGEDKKPEAPPLMLEFIGVDSVNTSVMGISTQREQVFTTLPQVQKILQELKAAGVEKMQIKLTGFFKKGYVQPFAATLKLHPKVGTQEDLKNLKEWAKNNNTELYFDADIQYAYCTSPFAFNPRKDTVSLINKEQGRDYSYNLVTFQKDKNEPFRYILRPAAIEKAADHVAGLMSDLGTGFSLRYVGSDLNSDFRKSAPVEREEALRRLEASVSKLAGKNSLITNGANAWALPYVKAVSDVSMRAMQFDICDETVPFLQMVLQGHVYYSDEHRNISGDTMPSFLDTVRTGGALSYVLTAEDNMVFTKTAHKELTSTQYSVWKDRILKTYKAASAAVQHTATGIKNSYLADSQLYCTEYNDGSCMVANYSGEQKTYKNTVVEPYAYIIMESEN